MQVNYQAKKDYEVLTNYKIFQAAVTSVGFDRDLKAQVKREMHVEVSEIGV